MGYVGRPCHAGAAKHARPPRGGRAGRPAPAARPRKCRRVAGNGMKRHGSRGGQIAEYPGGVWQHGQHRPEPGHDFAEDSGCAAYNSLTHNHLGPRSPFLTTVGCAASGQSVMLEHRANTEIPAPGGAELARRHPFSLRERVLSLRGTVVRCSHRAAPACVLQLAEEEEEARGDAPKEQRRRSSAWREYVRGREVSEVCLPQNACMNSSAGVSAMGILLLAPVRTIAVSSGCAWSRAGLLLGPECPRRPRVEDLCFRIRPFLKRDFQDTPLLIRSETLYLEAEVTRTESLCLQRDRFSNERHRFAGA